MPILTALAAGLTIAQAAKQCKVSETTIRLRLKDPKFKAALKRLQKEYVRQTNRALVAAGVHAALTLRKLLHPKHPPSVRQSAARSLLDIGLKFRESWALDQRLGEVEKALASSLPGAVGEVTRGEKVDPTDVAAEEKGG
jgi:hypothetical protein